MKTSTLAVVVVVIIAIIGLGWWWYAKAPSQTNGNTTLPAPAGDVGAPDTGVTGGPGATAPAQATVHLTQSGFSPATVTVAKGGTVTWVNDTAEGMWVASATHPTHAAYSGTTLSQHCGTAQEVGAFDQCKTGGSFSFTFDKAGSWKYHNHVSVSQFGAVEVQ